MLEQMLSQADTDIDFAVSDAIIAMTELLEFHKSAVKQLSGCIDYLESHENHDAVIPLITDILEENKKFTPYGKTISKLNDALSQFEKSLAVFNCLNELKK